MGDADASEMEWGEDFFSETFDKAGRVIVWISRKQKPFARFQSIAKALIAEGKITCGAAMLNFVLTRFASRVTMSERLWLQRKVYRALPKDPDFVMWLPKQKKAIRDEVILHFVCHRLL